MTISRRPKMRASTENAPGPRKTKAIAIAISNAAVKRNSSKFPLSIEDQGSTRHIAHKAVRIAATGVMYPVNNSAPLRSAIDPIIMNNGLRPSRRYTTP